MIILIDNENYMIRYCKDDPDIYGFSTILPNWRGLMKFYSDLGFTVVMSGSEVEDYLDENNIYYIHVENKKKESFETFVRRLERMVRDNEEFLKMSTSQGRLICGLTSEYSEDVTPDTENLFECWRLNEDNKYHLYLPRLEELPVFAKKAVFKLIKQYLDKLTQGYRPDIKLIEEEDTVGDYSIYVDKSLAKVLNTAYVHIANYEE